MTITPDGHTLLELNKQGLTYQKLSEVFQISRNAVAGRIDRTRKHAGTGEPFSMGSTNGAKPDDPDLEYTYNPEMILTVSREPHMRLDESLPRGFEVIRPAYLAQRRELDPIDVDLADLSHERFKPCVLDIETTDFSATDGPMTMLVCAVVAPLNKSDGAEAKTFRLSWRDGEIKSDYNLLQEVIAELNKWDIVIGHNVGRFDINWLISRVSQYYGFPPRTWFYYDTLSTARALAWLGRKGLAPLCASLKIPNIKTSVQKATWADVYSPIEADFEYTMHQILYHCVEDVKSNRVLFNYLYPYGLTLPTNQLKVTKWRVGAPR